MTAGIKSADILIEGENAYGFLKGENGVHRLVRISPFDAIRPPSDLVLGGRGRSGYSGYLQRTLKIKPDDYEMQVYRSSGAGGQHINKTSSAVRLIHKATGIVVACQTERSQLQNQGELSCSMLRSKLVEIKEREHLEIRSRTSRAFSRRLNGAARSAPTFSCRIRLPRIRVPALKMPISTL